MGQALEGPACGHSACRQNWIDTGETECVERIERRPEELSRKELVQMVTDIECILWGANGDDPDREWDSETLDAIAGTLTDAGLGPTP